MIITVAPFPSIEYIYRVSKLTAQNVVSAHEVTLNILSKGVYAAHLMKVVQAEPIVLGVVGGFTGKYIKHYLDKAKVKSDFTWSDSETTQYIKLVDESVNNHYFIKTKPMEMIPKDIQNLGQHLNTHMKKVSTMLLAGELPQGADASLFAKWLIKGKAHNIKGVVSTGQREVLEKVIAEKPYALMFTAEQLQSLGMTWDSYETLITELAPLLKESIHYIAVYLKEEGALILSKSKYCFVAAPFKLLHPNNTASSGAFLGMLTVGISRKYEQEKFAKLCLAAALCADDNVAHAICNRKDIETVAKKVKVKEIFGA